MNALWFDEITFGKIFFNMFAKTFDTSLYMTSHRLIGWYSLGLQGFFFCLWNQNNISTINSMIKDTFIKELECN